MLLAFAGFACPSKAPLYGWLFEETVHRGCTRAGFYEEGTFAEEHGDKECLVEIGFHDKENPRLLMHRMRRLFNRTQLEENECNILRGIFSKIQGSIK